MRYIKQRTNNECGPVAFLNLLKTLGYKYTYRDIYRVRKLVGYIQGEGTYTEDITKALKRCEITHRVRWGMTLTEASTYLSAGNILMMYTRHGVWDEENDWHVFLLVGKNKAIGLHSDRTTEILSQKKMKQLFSYKERGCWIINIERNTVA